MNKPFARTLLALAVIGSISTVRAEEAAAEESSPLSFNVALVSDYVFDGVSQTDNGPALQGGVDYAFDSGLYVGAWASTVDFTYFGDEDATAETDWYVGYGFGGETFAFDVGAVAYKYISAAHDSDYVEVYAGVTIAENFTLKAWQTSDYANLGFSSRRIKASYEVAINDNWAMPLEVTNTKAEGVDAYNSFKVGVATSVGDIGVELSYQKTDIDAAGDKAAEDNFYTEGGVVLALSAHF